MRRTTDFTTLGRLGTASGPTPGSTFRGRGVIPGSGGAPGGRPSTKLPVPSLRSVAIAVAVTLIGLFILGTTAQSQLDTPAPLTSMIPSMDPMLEQTLATGVTQMAATGARTLLPGGGSAVGMVEVPSAFAALEDLALILPNHDVTSVVFSEADVVDMLPLAPVGVMAVNANPEGFEAPRALDGPEYRVLQAETGVRPASGMARLYMEPGASVLSPVTGTVVAVDQVTINGTPEWRVSIQPATRSDLHVVVKRLSAAAVSVGAQVGVGQDALGQASRVQVEPTEHNPEGNPSIWIGVRPGLAADAIDVNKPAVEASAAAS